MTHGIDPVVSLLIPPLSRMMVATIAAMKWPRGGAAGALPLA